MERLVIIGAGMASARLVEELTQRAPGRFRITIVGAEKEPAYNRVLLSPFLAGEITWEDVRLKPAAWYEEHGVELICAAAAAAIDPLTRTAQLASGRIIEFDKCVLATGSSPLRLPINGSHLPGVMTFRTAEDAAAMKLAAARGAPCVVIGGGLLGIEAAYGLARLGAPVTLLHIMDRLMERQLDAEAAALLKRAIEAKGIRVMLGAQTEAIMGGDAVEAIRLKGGEIIPCALAVMAAGVRPETALAKAAGLAVNRGVLVDDGLAASAPGIYAIGECAEHRGLCCGLVEPAYEQARALAKNLAGEEAHYAGSATATNLKVSGVPVFSAGDFEGEGAESIILRDAALPAYRKLVIRGGRLAGAVLYGDTADALWYLDLIRSGAPISAIRSALPFGRDYAEAA